MDMKLKYGAGLALCFLAPSILPAQPILTFESSDPHIVVGDLFDIHVYIEFDAVAQTGFEAELTSFGFDFTLTGSSSLMDIEVPADPFFDSYTDSSTVEALAFPGITDNKVLISTFSLNALSEGEGLLAINGPVDTFGGAFYESIVGFDPVTGDELFEVFEHDLYGEYRWTVDPVPEPRHVALLGIISLFAMILVRRRLR